MSPTPKTRAKTSAKSASATYVYCVVKGDAKRAVAGAKRGKRGEGLEAAGAPRTIDVGDGYHVVVSDVPLSLYSAEAIEAKLHDLEWVGAAASAHETVVESAGASGTVVPMKLFTIFSSDDRAADHVRKMKKSLDKVVAKISGCEEWGLRILFDEAGAAKAKEKLAAKRPKAPVSGTSFLLRKKATEETRRRLTSEAKHEVDDLFVRLEKTAKRAVRRPPPNRALAGQVLLDAVFLVPEKRTKQFKTTVATHAKELADQGYHVTLSGPWPAYSFIGGDEEAR
ncbi:MAG: hypothetical protein QOI41_5061 [Myxococcales bacterium]|nr:hypothetical protein [Myxococcales bacterium]